MPAPFHPVCHIIIDDEQTDSEGKLSRAKHGLRLGHVPGSSNSCGHAYGKAILELEQLDACLKLRR
jgi:hypothetical protein